jgi:hypothetical protein
MFESLKSVPELYDFVNSLQWYYLITLIIVMYGVKHTDEMDWFVDLTDKIGAKKAASWIAALIVMGLFCLFRGLDPELELNSAYIADILRTMVLGVIFSNLFIELPLKIFNKFYTKREDDE